jgi:subtilisin family serine protease
MGPSAPRAPQATRSLALRQTLVLAALMAGCDRGALSVEEAPAPSQVERPAASDQAQLGEAIAILDEGAMPGVAEPLAGVTDEAALSRLESRLDAGKEGLFQRLGKLRPLSMTRYSHLPIVHVRIASDEAMRALEADPMVLRVLPNEPHALYETAPALALINQPMAAMAGKQGAGATVAVLDTGADFKRAPFGCTAAGATNCPIVYAQDFAPDDKNVDDNGHGTNVSGIVLSVAPAAKVAALDVFNGSSAWTTDILAAINWTIQNKSKYNIVAINMSLGGALFTAPCGQDALAVGVASARAAGILSAVASGNSGATNGMGTPACAPDAISVGAVYPANFGGVGWPSCKDATTRADLVACFSCSASFLTMLAPGVAITAAGITMSGTSQATPHVAGAIAVLSSAFPGESPASLVTRLTANGVAVKDARNNITKPRLDLWASLNAGVPAPMMPAPPPPAPPTGTITLAGGAKYTKTAAVTVALAVTSGTATKMCLGESTTCTSWVAAAPSATVTLSKGDGAKTVRAWWKNGDGAASTTPATASITADTTAPTDGTFTGSGTGLTLNMSWSGFSDAGSGLAGYRLIIGSAAVAATCPGTPAYEGTGTAFTKTFAAGGTYYARLCAHDALGNVSAGKAATITVVPPPVTRPVVWSGAEQTKQMGSATGGLPYNDACPAGQALIGFSGALSAATTAGTHRQLTPRCGIVEVTGNTASATVTVRAGLTLPTRGKAGPASWTRDCPTNQVVVGFAGRSGLLIDQLTFSCAPLAAKVGTAGTALTVGTATNLAAIGGTGGTAFTANKCPTNQVATVSRVRVGDNMDAFGLGCGKAVIGN